ncbi:transmembrane protein 41A-B-like [Haliotis rubra]|uniref:transmembrane protein 41A-B-like n=1 Tax=Haliotis rubra TaxID=36100 RepID=UPI001EE520E5|nr:transmembrane protein 41A-B-like [Haliotis rubra]
MGASVLFIPVFFALGSLGVYTLSVNFPEHTGVHSNSSDLKFPTNLDELQSVANFLHEYKNDHSSYVLVLLSCAYLYKQTFAIPGSVFMNLLAGATLRTLVGLIMSAVVFAEPTGWCSVWTMGQMPYIFICVQTGCILSEIKSLDDIFTLWTMAKLCGIAVVSLLPGFLIKKHRAKQKGVANLVIIMIL